MSYFEFLAVFLGLPILVLAALVRRRTDKPGFWPILVIALIALVYTTPWDNYLVATRVWWYDPELVTGIVIGWVPIEEYTFFIVQPILVGLWLQFASRPSDLPAGGSPGDARLRRTAALAAGLIWLFGTGLLLSGWRPGTYLGLELAWALPPIILQLAYGADLLREQGRLVLLGILPPTLYLSAADSLAIGFGTWTIDPAQSTGILIGALPLEEFVFFLLTNTLVTFGLLLIWAPESRRRLSGLIAARRRRMQGPAG